MKRCSTSLIIQFSSVQFSSVVQSCSTLCDPTNHSMPGLPVHHQLPEFTQIHVHRVSDAIRPSHPLSSPSPPAPIPPSIRVFSNVLRCIQFFTTPWTAAGNCSHEIKRRLLLGRKVMTNLDSILKSRGITLPTKSPSSQGYGFSSGHAWM